MKKETAREIMDLTLQFSSDIDETLLRIKENSTQEEYEKYTKALARVLGCMFLDIMTPIMKKYPELTPDELKDKS